jgi:hypothetical protein
LVTRVVVVLQPDTSTTPSNTHIIRDACFIRRDFIGAPQLNIHYGNIVWLPKREANRRAAFARPG